ncbi:MAG TPA: cyanophycinase [Polyangiaceae bacterium]|nr:cyanophycinase [Polyangiaceae bacterium]
MNDRSSNWGAWSLLLVIFSGCVHDEGTQPDAAPTTDAFVTESPEVDGKTGITPPGLVSYLTGNGADVNVSPDGPGLILMGGGPDVDEAFEWWRPKLRGGDVVVLRTSGADGYNDYLYSDIGGCDSVETLLVTSRELANSNYVSQRVAQAEGIFITGGDQATYLNAWKGTKLEGALQHAWARGAIVGGTSAGCAVLGEFAYAAYQGSVFSSEALANPYDPRVTLERDFVDFPPLRSVITDTHFAARDRMGRLAAFVGRVLEDGWASTVTGLGVDEATALLVESDGFARVVGDGYVYALDATSEPAVCEPGEPLTLRGLSLYALRAGDTIRLPDGSASVNAEPLDVVEGALSPVDPY